MLVTVFLPTSFGFIYYFTIPDIVWYNERILHLP